MICHHVFVCVCFSSIVHHLYNINMSNPWFLSLLLPYIFISAGLDVSHCHSVVLHLHPEKHIGCFCVLLKERERMLAVGLYLYIMHTLVWLEKCAFICGAVLLFPTLVMFKASSCAVRTSFLQEHLLCFLSVG